MDVLIIYGDSSKPATYWEEQTEKHRFGNLTAADATKENRFKEATCISEAEYYTKCFGCGISALGFMIDGNYYSDPDQQLVRKWGFAAEHNKNGTMYLKKRDVIANWSHCKVIYCDYCGYEDSYLWSDCHDYNGWGDCADCGLKNVDGKNEVTITLGNGKSKTFSVFDYIK